MARSPAAVLRIVVPAILSGAREKVLLEEDLYQIAC